MKVCSWIVTYTFWDFIYRSKSYNNLVYHKEPYNRKVLLSSFHLNGYTLGFNPQNPAKVKNTLYSTTGTYC